ncbi:MAG: hypothetical protein HZB24_08050 [Desulfobacterales bacterium]|nr:hypothetical protein [Desulfobacterales bacterium]
MDSIQIEYCFQMDEAQSDRYLVTLDPGSLTTLDAPPLDLPPWSMLQTNQCPNCPLDPLVESHCPAAVNMVRLVTRFDQLLSYEKTLVSVTTEERKVFNHTTVQRGICSLMGLLMATSRCPRTAFFKPMARFHLPFASTQETIWRATSSYLLSQYFRYGDGGTPDFTFKGLSTIYGEIQIVNKAFARRLRAACRQDSMVNAIILLDMFAKSMPTAIEASLAEIRELFSPYLRSCE